MVYRVAVTGASGYIGSRLLARLKSDPDVEAIVAIDHTPLPSEPDGEVRFHQRDINEPLEDLFRENGVNAVVHLAFVLRPGHNRAAIERTNVAGTSNLLHASSRAGVATIVYLSSTTVYGARPDNPPLLTEEHPLRPQREFQYAWDKTQVEAMLQGYGHTHPQARVVVLRSCVVMGQGAENFITRALSKPFLVAVKGYDPPMQFLYQDDLTELMALALKEKAIHGAFNVAGDGAVPYSEMVALSGRRLLRLPASVLYPFLQATWNLRIQGDSPSVGLDFIRYPWVADTARVRRETGYRFRYTSREALMAYLGSGGRGMAKGRKEEGRRYGRS
ncbi:MAG: SDR family oxidoreductase [Chloroflexi bacterium]|nr:SDR family oxidoreductase [Chloroflexota bacterium]